MGIFADFRAQTRIDLTPPNAGNNRIISNDIDRLENQFGDIDTPPAFVGRSPALAILYVSGVIAGPPPIGTANVEGVLNRGNNALAPKEVTIRALSADAAVFENNSALEQGILEAVKYPAAPHVGQTFPVANKLPIITYSGTPDSGVNGPFGPLNIGESLAISPVVFSDPDITGSKLDSVICEAVMSFAPGGGSWVDLPNAVAAGVEFVSGGPSNSTSGWTIRGTINQLNAAVVGMSFTSDDFGPLTFDCNLRLSDLGHAGTGGIKQSPVTTFRFDLL